MGNFTPENSNVIANDGIDSDNIKCTLQIKISSARHLVSSVSEHFILNSGNQYPGLLYSGELSLQYKQQYNT